MTPHPHLDPSPFWLEGGPVGVLLIHGHTGAPPEMRLVADYLHGRGLTVSAPLLPGHGTSVAEMRRCTWTGWVSHVERALDQLQARCSTVFVGGLSLGALLALYVATRRPGIAGIIAYSPATWAATRLIYLTPVAKYFVPYTRRAHSNLVDPVADQRIWCYGETPTFSAHEVLKLQLHLRRLLPKVTAPLLIVYSRGDTVIHPQSGPLTYRRAGSADKQMVVLDRSGHAVTVDIGWEFVAAKSYEFIAARSPIDPGG